MATKQETRAELTDKQIEALEVIKKFVKKNGYAPSINDIAKAMGLATAGGAVGHLNALERKGYIARRNNQPRAIQVLQ